MRKVVAYVLAVTASAAVTAADALTPQETAAKLDGLILDEQNGSGFETVDDAIFLRRVSLDLIGRPPSPSEITRFGLNPAPDKRRQVVDRLLNSQEYARNWSRYWRDTIFRRATNTRANLVRPAFEKWMTANLETNRSWDSIVADLLTAEGTVNGNGETALLFAHEGEPEEIAAEASRLFLGIQIQCANCHDHPWDRWKREEFHQFAAFFPRVSVRRDRSSDSMFDYEIVSVNQNRSRRPGISQFLLTRIDRNRDGYLTEDEARNTPLQRIFSDRAKELIDKNGDGRLSTEEIRTARPPDNNRPGQGSTEHYMADLSDPGSDGTLIHPVFFVNDTAIRKGQPDVTRRTSAAELITSRNNPWFSRAIVNRMWAELTGTAFYLPVDDIGPDRNAEHEDALEFLAEDFTDSGYDFRWLLTAITGTRLYQRPVNTAADGFEYLEPTRLRSDQFYDALCQTLNVTALPLRFAGRRGPYNRDEDPGRLQFAATFGFDPSIPKSDLTGSIPEALFMMNSPQLNTAIRAESPNSIIGRISRQVLSDEDVVRELYFHTLSREPTKKEVAICLEYISKSPNRKEGFEDLLWSLLNSSEFQSKR